MNSLFSAPESGTRTPPSDAEYDEIIANRRADELGLPRPETTTAGVVSR